MMRNTTHWILAPLLLLAVFGADAFAKSKDSVRLRSPGSGLLSRWREGRVRVRHKSDSANVTVRVKGLERHTRYLVVEDANDRVLTAFRTNRRGRAKVRIRDRDGGWNGAHQYDARAISIHDAASGKCVLYDQGAPDDGVPDLDVSSGGVFYTDEDESRRSVSISTFSMPEFEIETLTIMFTAGFAKDHFCPDAYVLTFSKGDGNGLPVGADTVAELGGRNLEIVDADSVTVFSGTVPATDDPGDVSPIATQIGTGRAPYSVLIEDSGGQLVDVGVMESGFDGPATIIVPPFIGWGEGRVGAVYFDDGGGRSATLLLSSFPDKGIEWLSVTLAREKGNAGGPVDVYVMTAGDDNGPDLPFGLKRVADLEDRAFQLRDATGKPIVSGSLPKLEDFDGPIVGLSPDGTVLSGRAPFSLYVADDGGLMTRVGKLERMEDLFDLRTIGE